jgi:MerR family transcriptional regulator, thiopeptide resistance regulator
VKTIRQLAAQFGLSRTALLYYDRLGLLRPEYRTSAGHRLYAEADEARLARICELRAAGMPLGEIDAVLDPSKKLRAPLSEALDRRLSDLNREIAALRRQQQVALALLRDRSAHGRSRVMTKERWVQLLTACGLDEADRAQWHREFEKLSPEAHQDFLESLGLPAAEIAAIRKWSAAHRQPRARHSAQSQRTATALKKV